MQQELINKAKIFKNQFIQDSLYNNNFLSKVARLTVRSNKTRARIKQKIEEQSSKDISLEQLSKDKMDIINNLDSSIIEWNNKQVSLLQKITRLNLDDWII